MRRKKLTITGFVMKVLGKGLIEMAEENRENNVVEMNPTDIAKIKLFVSQIKVLLEVKARDFADQYVAKQSECPEYLIDEDSGLPIVEKQLGKAFQKEDWDNSDLLDIAANAFSLVVIDHIAEYYDGEDTTDEEE